jgi:hypothetical protein
MPDTHIGGSPFGVDYDDYLAFPKNEDVAYRVARAFTVFSINPEGRAAWERCCERFKMREADPKADNDPDAVWARAVEQVITEAHASLAAFLRGDINE